MHAVSRCDWINSFSQIWKIRIFQALKNKINEQTDMIDFGEFPSLSLESPSVVQFNVYVIFMKKINQVQVGMNYKIECLPKEIWAEIVYHQLKMR